MKKITPYIFPLIVLAIVFFLVYRWYSLRGQQTAENAEFGEGIQIENLSEEEAADVSSGVGDVETAPLESTEGEDASTSDNTGTIRYEIDGNRVLFSVLATIGTLRVLDNVLDTAPDATPVPTPDPNAQYTVYIRSLDGDNLTRAFSLSSGKGGLLGSASISTDLLPVEVLVTDATSISEVLDNVLLRGVIEDSGEFVPDESEGE